MKARVHVFLKPGVLDPQGEAVARALHDLGFSDVSGARVGKLIELDLEKGDTAQVEKMCEKLLANPVIESWKVELDG